MVRKILKTPDGKTVDINTDKDLKLYNAPNNPPNTGMKYTRGVDLYMHKTRKGSEVFYKYFWSMWQGEEDNYRIVSREDAIDFLVDKAGLGGWDGLTEKEMQVCIDVFGEDIFEETA